MVRQDRGGGVIVYAQAKTGGRFISDTFRLKRDGDAPQGQTTTKRGNADGKDKREEKYGGPVERGTCPPSQGGGVSPTRREVVEPKTL